MSEKFSIGAKNYKQTKKTYRLHLSDKFSNIVKKESPQKIEKLSESRAWNMKGVLRIA